MGLSSISDWVRHGSPKAALRSSSVGTPRFPSAARLRYWRFGAPVSAGRGASRVSFLAVSGEAMTPWGDDWGKSDRVCRVKTVEQELRATDSGDA